MCLKGFLDPEGREGLTRATSHDHLTTIRGLQTRSSIRNSFDLMRVRCGFVFNLGLIQISKGSWVFYLCITEVIELEDCDGLSCPLRVFSAFASILFVVCSHRRRSTSLRPVSAKKEFMSPLVVVLCSPIALGLNSPDQTFVVPKDEVSP